MENPPEQTLSENLAAITTAFRADRTDQRYENLLREGTLIDALRSFNIYITIRDADIAVELKRGNREHHLSVSCDKTNVLKTILSFLRGLLDPRSKPTINGARKIFLQILIDFFLALNASN